MVDSGQPTLTPEEVGAFVTQWAERRNFELSELATLLGVDEAQAASLLRQARGRIHMNDWVNQNHRPRKGGQWIWSIVAGSLILGAVVGGSIANYLAGSSSQDQEKSLPHPQIQISTSESDEPKQNLPPRMPPAFADRVKTINTAGPLGDGDLERSNPDAAKVGLEVGSMLADLTVGIGHRPAAQSKAGNSPPSPESAQPIRTTLAGTSLAPITPNISHILHDMTNQLRTPLPADAVVELETPTDLFTMRGEKTNDPDNASRISQRELILPMYELVNYAMNSNLGQQYNHLQNTGKMGRIRISVGEAAASTQLAWDKAKPEVFTQYKNANCQIYIDLSKQVVDGIKILGPKLFVAPNRSLSGAS
jgi:hypothetical protein